MRHRTARAALLVFVVTPTSVAWIVGESPEAIPNYMYVSSYFTNEIYKFDRAGVLADVIVNGQIDGPEGLAFGPDGKLYVASRGNDRVLALELYEIAGTTAFDGPDIDEPVGLAFGPTGNLYIGCAGSGRIVECRLNGTIVRSIGAGVGMSAPNQITFGPEGHLFAADGATSLVYEFDPSGELVRTIGAGQLGSPVGITRAPGGSRNYYVTSLDDDDVVCLDAEGTVVGTLSHASLDGPRQMIGGPDGYLYVASDQSDRVVVFDPVTQQYVRDVGTGLGLNGVGGVAFEPHTLRLRMQGRFALDNDFEKVNQHVLLNYAPGSGTLMFAFLTPNVDQPSMIGMFDTQFVVLHGLEQSTEKSMLVSGTAVLDSASGDGLAHADVTLLGKRDANGQFRVKDVKGTLHRSGFGAQLAVRLNLDPYGTGSK